MWEAAAAGVGASLGALGTSFALAAGSAKDGAAAELSAAELAAKDAAAKAGA